MANKKRIALFGGSFDPIHTDHINIIKACHDKLGFEEVWIVPAYVNPFKNISTSSVTQRLQMIDLATSALPYVMVSQYEISKQQKSYTYDTVLYFQTTYPDYDFTFIMGSDQLDHFESWNYFEKLIKTITFNVFLRNEHEYNKTIVEKYHLEVFTFENNHISSTDIRHLRHLDLQIKSVNDYINNNLMYLYERLKSQMNEERYLHSLNVGQTALELAMLNNVDWKKALIAGTLHDIAKRWDRARMEQYLKKYNPALLNEPWPVWHSYVGGYHLQYDWLFDDKDVISAVFKHTVGDIEMSTLDMIVFCADKISSERDYAGVNEFRTLVKADLKLGFLKLLQNQVQVAIKKHGINQIGTKIKAVYKHWFKQEL